jgi:hypothetical protein
MRYNQRTGAGTGIGRDILEAFVTNGLIKVFANSKFHRRRLEPFDDTNYVDQSVLVYFEMHSDGANDAKLSICPH